MSNGFVVELEPGVWVAPWSGDPGRTLVIANAQQFDRQADAEAALEAAREFRPFVDGFACKVHVAVQEVE